MGVCRSAVLGLVWVLGVAQCAAAVLRSSTSLRPMRTPTLLNRTVTLASRLLSSPFGRSGGASRSLVAAGLASATVCASLLALAAPAAAAPAPAPDNSSKPLPMKGKPKVYVIPMTGQFGTDIIKDIYEEIIEDVRKVKPDFIVYHMNSYDIPKSAMIKDQDRQGEQGMFDPGEIRDLIKYLREEMRDLPQIMWVEDAYGPTSMVALAWPDLYMHNTARLGGLGGLIPRLRNQWKDLDVQAKMIAAWAGIIKGIMEQGGYSYELGDAFLYPERLLSASFEGRKVIFKGDLTGQWIIDDSESATIAFRATAAEDIGLSDGNADSFEDLMFILGYREVEKVESGQTMFDDYVRDWRRALEQSIEALQDAQAAEGRGDIKDIQKAKQLYEKVVASMKRYPAIEKRLQAQFGVSRLALELRIDQLREAISGSKRNNSGGGRSGGSSSPGGGGRGPGSR